MEVVTSALSSMLARVLAVSTFEWIKALVAPVLAFCALIIAATIAAATAKTRQAQQLDHDAGRLREQLDHDAGRLREQLDHDSERLGTQLEHERRMADLAAVRDVVEEGAVHLHRVAYVLDDVRSHLMSKLDEWHAKLTEFGERYDELSERMKVRLGPDHEVTREFVGAGESVLDIYRAIGMIRLEPPAEEAHVRVDRQNAINEQRQRITNARERFDTHRAGFIDAAARTAGAILPSR